MPYPTRLGFTAVFTGIVASACGGGSPIATKPIPSSFDVRVSAGAPVAGAMVTVYAVSDATGEVNTAAGAGGVLGSAGPTDTSGKVTVTTRSYSGPVQIVATGPAVFYPDPTLPPDPQGGSIVVQVPSSFSFSSYVATFTQTAPMVVPVTLLTTLADHAALAYARGLHPLYPGRKTITAALAARDPLFVTHITKAAAGWDRSTLRTTVPASLTTGPQSLVDVAFAALFDVALDQLAHDTASQAGYGIGGGGLTAPTLLQLLEQDVDADGQLDGRGAGGQQIMTAGSNPVAIDANFLRKSLAVSLDAWVTNAKVNTSSISDADLASAQVFSTITGDTSDLFGSAATLPYDPLDKMPPVLSFAAALPTYSSSYRVTIAVNATDASGVKAVHALVGSVQTAATVANGIWYVDVELPSVGHNIITVWAEDLAQPVSNSGFGKSAPYQLTADVLYDPIPPTATYDSSFASYYDERGMTVGAGADGLALVPPVFSTQPRTAVPLAGAIYKAATRLGAGGAPDAAELESTNRANVPVLRFSVPFNPSTDSPITLANYAVVVSCSGCGSFPTATGALLPSPTAVAGALYYDLPLATETLPALANVAGPATLAVTLDLSDAAGNTASVSGLNFTFHVIGPPIAVSEDTAYSSYGDPRSTYPYKVAGTSPGVNTYWTLWDTTSASFFAGQVRLVRYVISNPSPQPVAVSASYAQQAGGSWQMVETWPRFSVQEPPVNPTLSDPNTATAFSLDNFTFYQALYWATPYGTAGAHLAKTETASFPCSGGPTAGWAAHQLGDGVNKYICSPVTPVGPTETATFSVSDVAPALFAGPQQGGGEVVSPARDSSGSMFIVPAAAGSTPGTLVLYVTRPVGAWRGRGLWWNTLTALSRYETWDFEIFWRYYQWTFTTRFGSYVYDVYLAMRTGQYLQASTESLYGSVSIATQGLSSTTLVGEAAAPFSATLSRNLAAH